jgi:hypothetical protein
VTLDKSGKLLAWLKANAVSGWQNLETLGIENGVASAVFVFPLLARETVDTVRHLQQTHSD